MAHIMKYAVVVLALVQISTQYWTLSVTSSPGGTIIEGSNVTLTCTINSDNPDLSVWIEWEHNLYGISTLTEPTYVEGSHNLTLTRVSGNQAGYYACVGSISWTSNYWQPTTFSDWMPLPLLYGPIITNNDRTWIGANDTYTATIECLARSDPRATVTWYGPNGDNITEDTDPERVSVENRFYFDQNIGHTVESHLIINPVNSSTDYGMYRCRAANGIGTFVDHEIQLTETGKPEPPKVPRVHVSSTTIFVSWQWGYDGGEKYEDFWVNFRKIPEEFDPLAWVRHHRYQYSMRMLDLPFDTPYQVAVYATNRLGSSPYLAVDVRTNPANPFEMGITVIYIQSEGKFVISGIPEDDDAGTCLGLEGKLGAPTWEVVSLRPDLDCIQRDGEFLYSDPISTDRFDCRYCRDKVCGYSSFVDIVPIPTPDPNGPTDSKVVVIVAVSVSAGIFFLTLAIAMCYFCKCFSCGKTSPRDELRRNGPQPNPSVAVFNPSCDEPPSYVQAAELDVNAGKNDDEPPPAYDDCASSNAALQATDENEEQV